MDSNCLYKYFELVSGLSMADLPTSSEKSKASWKTSIVESKPVLFIKFGDTSISIWSDGKASGSSSVLVFVWWIMEIVNSSSSLDLLCPA